MSECVCPKFCDRVYYTQKKNRTETETDVPIHKRNSFICKTLNYLNLITCVNLDNFNFFVKSVSINFLNFHSFFLFFRYFFNVHRLNFFYGKMYLTYSLQFMFFFLFRLVHCAATSIRFCVDYRKLNEITVSDAYPLPRCDDLLGSLAGCSFFTSLDMEAGY